MIPTTEAGRTLLENDLCDCVGDEISHDLHCRSVSLAPAILAIETQAAAAARAEIAEQVRAIKATCHQVGEPAHTGEAIERADVLAIIEGKDAK